MFYELFLSCCSLQLNPATSIRLQSQSRKCFEQRKILDINIAHKTAARDLHSQLLNQS